MIHRILTLTLSMTLTAAEGAPDKKKEKKVKAPAPVVASVGVHPLFTLESIDTEGGEVFRIGGMAFHQDVLYVTTLNPDRTNKGPFKAGKVLRVENVLNAGKDGQKLAVTTLCDWLYEPCAIAVIGGSIYVGEKDRIIRLDDGVRKDSFKKGEETVLLAGASSPNFHTYTIGFEHYQRDGQTFLCGNFTTAIQLGGKRDVMAPPTLKSIAVPISSLVPWTEKKRPGRRRSSFWRVDFARPTAWRSARTMRSGWRTTRASSIPPMS